MLPPTDVNHSKSFGEQTGRCRVVANQRVGAARTAAATGRNQMQLTGLKLGQGMPPAVERAAAQLLYSEPQREQGGKLRQVARGLMQAQALCDKGHMARARISECGQVQQCRTLIQTGTPSATSEMWAAAKSKFNS